MVKIKRTIIYKTQHRKLKIEQHETHKKQRVNSDDPKEYVVPTLLEAPMALLLSKSGGKS